MTPEIVMCSGDEDQYPAEDCLEAIKHWPFKVEEAMPWLREALPLFAKLCAYSGVFPEREDEDGNKLIDFATGGWSGAEDFINAINENHALNYRYMKWERGGLHTFQVAGRR